MITTLVSDLSYVLLFPKDKTYTKELNVLHQDLSRKGDYPFWNNFKLNLQLLNYIKTLKDKYNLYIFTSGTIQNVPSLKIVLNQVFKEIYSASELDVSKKDPKAYETIANRIGRSFDEILFIDDNKANIEAAVNAGLQGLVYQNNNQAMSKLKSLGVSAS